MAVSFQLDVITPEEQMLSEDAGFIVAPGVDGCFGVLPGHAHLVTLLNAGELSVGWGEKPDRYAISGGYAEVTAERVTILVERAVAKLDIDPSVAREEMAEAQKELDKLVISDPEWSFWNKRLNYAKACLEVHSKKD
ncbi:MAG: ATP synthase F1 subunit epsilon [Magnetococcales bacterium]|nr:ATP synthase F1 subunit epsilon [Magnetococcales bacterium]